MELTNNGTLIATGAFSFAQSAGGPKTVSPSLNFDSSPLRTIDQWYILCSGNPTTYVGEITVTELAVSVPEPSAYAMTLAGLACGGWQMCRRRRLKVRLAAW